jgi:protein-S-isoprenylcysteine O-methyltransferase Ste14
MIRIPIFAAVSAILLYISRASLLHPQSHGFYRFFAWESIMALVLLNSLQWFETPFSPQQVVSWLLLLISAFLVVNGVYLLKVIGQPNQDRFDAELLELEKTSSLVTVGAYKYIRHPLYSSLLFLTWGAFLKNPSWLGFLFAVSASTFLLLTAKKDESECLRYFGNAYQTYMQGTKRFIPFLF